MPKERPMSLGSHKNSNNRVKTNRVKTILARIQSLHNIAIATICIKQKKQFSPYNPI